MSVSSSDQKADYDMKKKFLEDLKTLNKYDYEQMFRIIKENGIEYSENSNGIFFDLNTLSTTIFEKLQNCIVYSKNQKTLELNRFNTANEMFRPMNIENRSKTSLLS